MIIDEYYDIMEAEREGKKRYRKVVNVCVAASCASSGSIELKNQLQKEAGSREDLADCKVQGVGCMGLCSRGPLVSVEPDQILYGEVQKPHTEAILDSLDGSALKEIQLSTNTPFFQRQQKIVLENSGIVDPERIHDAISRGGYEALYTALTTLSPLEVIDHVTRSGLRGRGGGGYPTGLKWSTVAKMGSRDKVVVCNADEGDPGAFMDRSVLESDPHRVIEGMAIAAYAVGASTGYIYIRAEYPLAIDRLKKAIKQAEQLGLLGNQVFGTPFHFTLQIRLGAGAFVCGEETALIASINGRRGTPRPRPPYPAEVGLRGMPTLINNVETYANIAPIIRNGGDWYASIGTEKSRGTKVFALAGRVKNTGLIEVPMGISLRDIIFQIGGGMSGSEPFKAVQTGGPSGGCLPETHLDMPVEYDSLKEAGSIMGSGGMIVIDESSSMIDVARYFMEFSKSESCGKCVPCRVGTHQLHRLLSNILNADATMEDLENLESLCDMVQNTSLCGLGQSAPNPVVSTLQYFRDEYIQKIESSQKQMRIRTHLKTESLNKGGSGS